MPIVCNIILGRVAGNLQETVRIICGMRNSNAYLKASRPRGNVFDNLGEHDILSRLNLQYVLTNVWDQCFRPDMATRELYEIMKIERKV